MSKNAEAINESNNKSTSDNLQIHSLTPKILEKGMPGYEAVQRLKATLKVAFEKKEIRNIALSGAYGSGKSSVLKTLRKELKNELFVLKIEEKLRKRKKGKPVVLEISGARLCKAGYTEAEIEYSILQQLVYREQINNVPSSRMRRIKHLTKYTRGFHALLTVLFFLFFFVAIEPSWARIDTLYQLFNWGVWNKWIDTFAVLYMAGYSTYFLYRLTPSAANIKLGKLSLSGTTIEPAEGFSAFNKHLDEILYFFKATKYNVVFIEDLDRLDSLEIFTKLKELNTLLNTSKAIGRHIVFIYAVRDDLFAGEDRTKFFDYIVPVVSFINASNSAEKLKETLGTYADHISDDDLGEIACFIQDMRMLKNIVNEFELYHAELCKDSSLLEPTKLLAMIVYKNNHPDDFAKLQRGKGKVYQCIDSKEELIQILKEEGFAIQSTKLSDLLSDKNAFAEYRFKSTYKDCNLSPLMEVFLCRGYLDEAYYDYISYFHEGMITQKDNYLLLAMKRGIPQSPETRIENVRNFYKRLMPYIFENKSILNNDLIDYIVRTNKPIKPIMDLIQNEEENGSEFLPQYYNLGKEFQRVCEEFTKRNKELSWIRIIRHDDGTKQLQLYEAWFRAAEDATKESIVWLNNNYKFLATHFEQIGRDRCFELCNMAKFTLIQPSLNQELFDYVIKKNAYKLNKDNLTKVVATLAREVIETTKLRFSDCLRTKNEDIVNYVRSEWSDAQSLFGGKLEDRASIQSLLGASMMDFIQQEYRFPDYTTIDRSVHDLATESLLIDPRWDNVFFYFEEKNQILTKELSKYLKHTHKALAQQPIDIDEIDEQAVSALREAIKCIRGISKVDREALLSAFPKR